jgi:hypothetical protein
VFRMEDWDRLRSKAGIGAVGEVKL